MHSNKRLVTGILAGTVVGVATSLSLNVFAFKQNNDDVELPLPQLQKFTEVYARVKQDYVETPDSKEMMNNAIRGMLTGLDPHSDYLDEEAYKELQVGTTGEFGGLGIEVGMEDGFVKVIAPIDDTPAKKAGLAAGDLIIRLDDKPVKGMTLNDAVKVMRGKPGTDIELLIIREGQDKPFTVTITRDIIKVQSVKNRMLEPGYGYIRISSFQSKTTEALLDAIEELRETHGDNLRGLILDLRNNPGGVLNAAVGVSDAFLNDGKIVYTEGRVADAKMEYNAREGDALDGAPIVVMVNQGSASASEIVSGALQDHKRAVIIGEKTFGKGSVQTVLPLDQKTALKLTTARYFTPSGRSIQAEGILPDIEIKPRRFSVENEDENIRVLSEADFDRHLTNPTKLEEDQEIKPEDTEQTVEPVNSEENDKQSQQEDGKKMSLADEDYQLFEALNILKGMDLVINRNR